MKTYVRITEQGLDRIPGARPGDRFEVKSFTDSYDSIEATEPRGRVAHVLQGASVWSLGVGDWTVDEPRNYERELSVEEAAALIGAEKRFLVRRTLSYARTVKGRTDDFAEATRWAERETALGYPCEVVDTWTTTKAAVELEFGDVLIGGTARKLKTVTSTSRAAASTADRICVFATTTDVDGNPIRTRFFFDLDEQVEVLVGARAAELAR